MQLAQDRVQWWALLFTVLNLCNKYQMSIDVQSEHNYVTLSVITQRINYMF